MTFRFDAIAAGIVAGCVTLVLGVTSLLLEVLL